MRAESSSFTIHGRLGKPRDIVLVLSPGIGDIEGSVVLLSSVARSVEKRQGTDLGFAMGLS